MRTTGGGGAPAGRGLARLLRDEPHADHPRCNDQRPDGCLAVKETLSLHARYLLRHGRPVVPTVLMKV